MDKKSSDLNFHQRMELIVKDMIDKEINLKDALLEFEKIFYEQGPGREGKRPGWPRPRHPPEYPSQPVQDPEDQERY
jgi:hypothetical protein